MNITGNQLTSPIAGPSSVADLIGYSVRLARDNARLCIRTLMWPTLIELIGKIIILIGINALIGAGPGNMFVVAGGLLTCAIGGAIGMGAEFFLTMRQLALFRLVAGYDSSFESAYKFVFKKKFQLIAAVAGTYFLSTFAITFWAVQIGISIALMGHKAVAIIAFAAACVGILLLFLSLIITFLPIMFIAPAVAIEDKPFSKLIGWSFKISTRTIIRSTGFLFLVTVVLIILSSVLNIPPSILSAVELAGNYMTAHAAPKTTPNLYIQIFASIWRSGVNMVLSPMAFFAFGFYYLDLRMRFEGLDLTRRLEALTRRAVSPF